MALARVSPTFIVSLIPEVKADINYKACTGFQVRGKTCAYGDFVSVIEKKTAGAPRGQASLVQKPGPMLVSPPPSTPALGTPPASVAGEDREAEPDLEQSQAYYTAHGRFAGRVAAAIDVRTGIIPTTCHEVPLVDAALFGDLDLPSQSCLLSPSTELPPRAYADQLVDIYWRHVDPVEPVLDRQRFFENYEKAYSTPITPLCPDYDLWLGIFNVVFALAVQRQEYNPLHQRNEEGSCFFKRAWALLPAESMLWKRGSLELVQCLMLMNRYLHCTSNQQKTWMTAGLAMRIAQSMCCHLAEAPLVKGHGEDKALKRKVWASCVALDRYVMEDSFFYSCH